MIKILHLMIFKRRSPDIANIVIMRITRVKRTLQARMGLWDESARASANKVVKCG